MIASSGATSWDIHLWNVRELDGEASVPRIQVVQYKFH